MASWLRAIAIIIQIEGQNIEKLMMICVLHFRKILYTLSIKQYADYFNRTSIFMSFQCTTLFSSCFTFNQTCYIYPYKKTLKQKLFLCKRARFFQIHTKSILDTNSVSTIAVLKCSSLYRKQNIWYNDEHMICFEILIITSIY